MTAKLQEFVTDLLREAIHQRYVDLGYWCDRCDLLAPPMRDDEPIDGGNGWCRICGHNPLDYGPFPPPFQHLTGLFGGGAC